MALGNIREIGRSENAAVVSYKIEDDKLAEKEAAVTVFRWEGDATVNAHCMACDAYKCAHADAVLRHHTGTTQRST